MIKINPCLNNSNNSVAVAKNTCTTSFGANFNGLAPLKKDTVSFSGARKYTKLPIKTAEEIIRGIDDKQLKKETRSISKCVAADIHADVCQDAERIKKVLTKTIAPLISILPDEKHPVVKFEYRVKTPNSIREKATQKGICKKQDIKDKITDLAGARIILSSNVEGGGNRVIEALIDSCNKRQIKVVEVENITPLNANFSQASQGKLEELAQASRRKFKCEVKEKTQRTATGYSAIHILFELPSGYKGEIQIIEEGLAKLKELEDIPYKLLSGKSIKPMYKDFKEVFASLVPISEACDPAEAKLRAELRKDFANYTLEAYTYERTKSKRFFMKRFNTGFLPLEEYKKNHSNSNLPDELDLNNLQKLKNKLDSKNKKMPE